MKKEISYYQQALELPEFTNYLLGCLIMASKEDTLECIALRYLETQKDRAEYIPAQIEVGA